MNTPTKTPVTGLLYPAFHKLYSALHSLEQFNKGNNFFENITYLDNFFSEYRNVTFMLQKSLAHTEYIAVYEKNKGKFLTNKTSTWFVEKRNEVLKEHPFDLEKRINITVYAPLTSIELSKYTFTIENDVEFSTIINDLRKALIAINHVEVFFSAEFSFHERGRNNELYEDLLSGIENMIQFLKAMKIEINEDCKLCDEIHSLIDKMIFFRVPKDMLFIDDYVYYPQKDSFEKASQTAFFMGQNIRAPLSNIHKYLHKELNKPIDDFADFVLMHLFMFKKQKNNIMPTFMIIYDDNTFELISFTSSIKTTIYRKTNEIANRIEADNIKTVFFVTEMLSYSKISKELYEMDSTERATHKTSEMLCFFSLDKELHERMYDFESDKVHDDTYINERLQSQTEGKINFFLHPIKNKFKMLHKA